MYSYLNIHFWRIKVCEQGKHQKPQRHDLVFIRSDTEAMMCFQRSSSYSESMQEMTYNTMWFPNGFFRDHKNVHTSGRRGVCVSQSFTSLLTAPSRLKVSLMSLRLCSTGWLVRDQQRRAVLKKKNEQKPILHLYRGAISKAILFFIYTCFCVSGLVFAVNRYLNWKA